MFNDFDDEIWDEHQWEAHLNEIEKQNTRLQKYIAPDASDRTSRWLDLIRNSNDTFDAVDAFIEEELQFDDPYFMDDFEDDNTDWSDEIEDDFFEGWEDEDLFFNEKDDFDAGEEWKELSEEFTLSNNGSIETLAIYNQSRELAAAILRWLETIHPQELNNFCNDFAANTLKIGAKIAGGYSFGFEREFLGGNIAYTKKALHCANDALTILQRDLKSSSLLTNEQYHRFHKQLFELRNNIGIYIQEMRDKFYTGI